MRLWPEELFLKNEFTKKHQWVLIVVLLVLGFGLRFWNLPQQLFFGPEQGIDALVVKEMVENAKLRLIGPKTDIDGIFHGPHFYYLSAIPYLLSGGNPVFSIAWVVLFSTSTIFLLFLVARELFSEKVAIWAAIFYAFSYGAIVYSRWLSTHAFVPFFFLLSFYLFLKSKRKPVLLSVSLFFAAVASQLEILNVLYLIPFFGFLIFLYRKNLSLPNIIFSIAIFFLSFSNFLFFDLRHNFLITHRIMAVLRGEAGFSTSFLSAFKVTLATYLNEGAFFLLPIDLFWGRILFATLLLILFLTLFFQTKSKGNNLTLFSWLVMPIVILGVTRQAALSQFFVILGPAFTLLLAYVLNLFWGKGKFRRFLYILAGVFILMHLFTLKTFLPENKLVFFQAPQPHLRLVDQISAIEYIYQDAGQEKFSFVAYTIPYWMEQGWQYLFQWYGGKKYGFVPQKGEGGIFYMIWQKDYNNLSYQNDWFKKMDQKSKAAKEQKFGEVYVQKRLNTEK